MEGERGRGGEARREGRGREGREGEGRPRSAAGPTPGSAATLKQCGWQQAFPETPLVWGALQKTWEAVWGEDFLNQDRPPLLFDPPSPGHQQERLRIMGARARAGGHWARGRVGAWGQASSPGLPEGRPHSFLARRALAGDRCLGLGLP